MARILFLLLHVAVIIIATPIIVTVNNAGVPVPTPDTTAPSVLISAPSANSTQSGSVTLSANASDNVGVAGVQFKVDGSNVGVEDTSAPYTISWNSTQVTNGVHSITAIARDQAGNTTTSQAVSVTVNNAPPTAVVSSVVVTLQSSQIAIGATTQASAVAKDATGAAISGKTATWASSNSLVATVNSSGLISALTAGTTTITATIDGKTASQTLTVTAVQDPNIITPTADIRANVVFPNGSMNARGIVAGTVNVTSKTPVTSVDIYVNNEMTVSLRFAPFNFEVDTTKYPDGNVAVKAVAKNAELQAAQDTVTLVVKNNAPVVTANLPQGTVVGDLVKFRSSPAIYLVSEEGLSAFDSYKSFQLYQRANPSEMIIEQDGVATSFTTTTKLAREILGQTQEQLASRTLPYPSGSLVNSNGTIYFISKDKKVPFTSAQAFLDLGYKFSNVVNGDLSDYLDPVSGYKITTSNQDHPFGSWILLDRTVYYSTESGMIGVPSKEILEGNGGSLNLIVPGNAFDRARLNSLPAQPPLQYNDSRVVY